MVRVVGAHHWARTNDDGIMHMHTCMHACILGEGDDDGLDDLEEGEGAHRNKKRVVGRCL